MTNSRGALIRELGEERQSHIICYLTTDRVPFPSQVALDALPIINRHLRIIGKAKKISLFLVSHGGSLDAPWPLVGLIREFCDDFEVIVPARALSAATLIALGADRIVMGSGSYLSPIDPRGTFEKDGQRQDIEIEDIFGFVDFAKEQVGLKSEEALAEVLRQLASQITPSMLGSANRAYHLIRSLARRLLLLHMDMRKDEARIEHIVKNLAQRLYSHSHLIYRSEARNDLGFGDCIEFAEDNLQGLMDTLYEAYEDLLGLGRIFNPGDLWDIRELQGGQSVPAKVTRAVIESATRGDHFITTVLATLDPQTSGISFTEANHVWQEMMDE